MSLTTYGSIVSYRSLTNLMDRVQDMLENPIFVKRNFGPKSKSSFSEQKIGKKLVEVLKKIDNA